MFNVFFCHIFEKKNTGFRKGIDLNVVSNKKLYCMGGGAMKRTCIERDILKFSYNKKTFFLWYGIPDAH